MKNTFIVVALFLLLISCGGLGEKKEHSLPNLGLSITIPGEPKIKPLEVTKACEFYIGKSRFSVKTIEEKYAPTDMAMLKEALKADDKFKAVLEEKTLENGAFGVIYEKNGKKEVFKEFVFYFKKEGTFFQIKPVFNGKGTYYDEGIEAIGSLK